MTMFLLIMNDDGIMPYDEKLLQNQLSELQKRNIVQTRGFFDLYGFTPTGTFVLAPSSYERGYSDAFLRPEHRANVTTNLIFFSQLSDGQWIYNPSYEEGIRLGNEVFNDIKSSFFAEALKRMFREYETIQLNSA